MPAAHTGASTGVHAPDLDGTTLFALAVSRGNDVLPGDGDRILLCLAGDVVVTSATGESLPLDRGQALYANAADGSLTVSGVGSVAQAYVP